MTYIQAIVIGLLQGVTELFPVSSLGHSVILPHLLGWQLDQHDPIFLTFLVATHTATALALFVFFLKDWLLIFRGLWQSIKGRTIAAGGPYGKLGWLLIVATVPAGILGLLLQRALENLFAAPHTVAVLLILNGALLWAADMIRKKRGGGTESSPGESDIRIAGATWWQAIEVGTMQALALIPGFSRTGSTITGGLLAGLSYEDAARFSFLLATPIIGAASVLKIPELLTTSRESVFLGQTIAGSLVAGIGAWLSVKFLLRYFETKTLSPFALYCVIAGAAASLWMLLG